METDGIISLAKAHTYLQTITSNEHILDEIRNIIYTWNYKSKYNLNAIKNDLDNIIDKVICQYCDGIYSKEVFKAVHCIVYNEIYENLIPLVRGKFSKEDLFLYEKCQSLCKLNVTPGQFGSSVYNSLSFTAAIVELSVLDNYKSPLEKLNCLCYTYDLIFAELKLALASLTAKYSEKELEIPVINNEDVIPVLATIMAKSNLLYFPSNLFYINFCGESLMEENYNNRSILAVFEIAFKKIMETEEDSIKPDKHKKFPHLDVCETIKIMSSSEAVRQIYSCSEKLREEERGRLVSLLSTSTSEKDFIPMNLPKMFN